MQHLTRASFCRQLFLPLMFIFFQQLAYAQQPVNRMDYHLSWDGQSTILKMDITYHSHGKDSTVFIYGVPAAGGQPRIFDILGNIKAGKDDVVKVVAAERKIVVQHSSPGLKTLHAEIDGKLITGPRFLANEAFRPTLAPGFLYTRGFQLFMDVPDPTYTQLGIVWDSWPKEMAYLVSTDPEAKPDQMQVISAEASVRYLFMVQMSTNLVITKNLVGKVPHYLLTSKSDSTSGLPKNIQLLTAQYIPAIRKFWEDYDAPFYILSAIPLQNEITSSITGMGFMNGLSVRYRGPLDLRKQRVIAHEISHNWIGVRLRIASTGMENNWFNEGFNDYVAIYNLVSSGLYTKEHFLDYLNNGNLKAHYTSPVKNMPGDSIAVNFFKSKYYEDLPYQRGFIYAFYLDNQIRLATKGEKTLKHFLQSLLTRYKKEGDHTMTSDDFIKGIAPFVPNQHVAEEIKRYMLAGELINFNQVKLIDAFKVSYQDQVPVISIAEGIAIQRIYH